MYCQNRIVHTVQAGDSLYKLSRMYQTTVSELIMGNPGVNPYNLQIGMKLNVCPGENYVEDAPNTENGNDTENTGNTGNQGNTETTKNGSAELAQSMRMAWLDHVYWTRMYLTSVLLDAPDQQAVEERLLETADEITDAFADFLSANAVRQLRNLLRGHIEIAGEMIQALKASNMKNYESLIKEWYVNANQIAALLGGQNPYFDNRETRNMMHSHLALTQQEIEQQAKGEYAKSIATFREIVKQAVEMADYFAKGLLAR